MQYSDFLELAVIFCFAAIVVFAVCAFVFIFVKIFKLEDTARGPVNEEENKERRELLGIEQNYGMDFDPKKSLLRRDDE